MLTQIQKLYALEVRMITYLQPWLLLVIRVYWGYQFFLTGRGKLLNIERTAAYFDSLHLPMPLANAYAAGATECLGGLCLLLGLASRVTTLPLIVTMLVAYATAHAEELAGVFRNPDAFVSAPPFLFLLASTLVLVFGPGALSADGVLGSIGSERPVNQGENER
jgi:putative oxidoreductase